jgi:hypothetical protein
MNTLKSKLSPYIYVAIAALLALALVFQGMRLSWATFQSWRVARIVKGWEEEEKTEKEKKPDDLAKKKPSPPDRKQNKNPGKEKKEDKYKAIVEKGVFAKKRQTPPPQLSAIMGDQAIFGSKVVGVGAQAGGWKVVEIGEKLVVIEKDGKKQTLKLFQELKMPDPPKPKPTPGKPSGPPDSEDGKKPPKEPETQNENSETSQSQEAKETQGATAGEGLAVSERSARPSGSAGGRRMKPRRAGQ